MTQAIIRESSKQNAQVSSNSLYDVDFLLWTESMVARLRAGDFTNLDLENLIEEIESLGKSQKKEIKSRLRTLIEHLLKRIYVNMPECFAGWENTIRTQRYEIELTLDDSPSLRVMWNDSFQVAFIKALQGVRAEYAHKGFIFPDIWQFSQDIGAILTVDFWDKSDDC